MKGTKGEQAKQCLIETAARLFLRKGYSSTGINDILSEADMSKGSFYFHFSSKKDLGFEVARYYGKTTLDQWLEPLSENPWDVFIKKMIFDIKTSVAEGTYFGCPLAVLGLDISFVDDDLSKTYAGGIIRLMSIFSKSLQLSGLTEEQAKEVSRRAFAIYEGHVLYYKISKDESAFDCMLKDLLSLV
ncbi:TetR/AcrR family transcriptional regulator [Clostridium cellulovorans]|uniref:Transcriptional regulator, TetR family n=1 Tax=Clostridium cellulovorans (strain ATCC 35296 / DSM 3052 / OCM 3 / 743B) TaxID=573061 RepID=D9STG7_CLOC7|nr:TetR/AcrR family transcriptional regulator [Clostridium cellulovorans]ADL52701.1 transcriptional regulator, TetR family [Clostridium cellulovorans 743B]